jgi:hypothetical protein
VFGNRDEVKHMIKKHAVDTRGDIVLIKNDNERVRAVCRGKLQLFSTQSF